jgi:hypothetical protein
MSLKNVFSGIAKAGKWVGLHVEEIFTDLPKALSKLIVLSDDAKDIASSAANEVIQVSTDVGALVAAVAKDDGASLAAIALFLQNAEGAIAAKGLNFTEDGAVITAIEQFFASINGTNYADVFTALAKTISDGKSMTTTVIADFKKLEADATS